MDCLALNPSSNVWSFSLLRSLSGGGRLAVSVKSWPHNCEEGVRSSRLFPWAKEPSAQLMGQCCHRPRWPKNCDCALCNYVLYHAVVSCSQASASLCLVCCDSCVVIVRDCARLSAINKACKLGGKPPYARRSCQVVNYNLLMKLFMVALQIHSFSHSNCFLAEKTH